MSSSTVTFFVIYLSCWKFGSCTRPVRVLQPHSLLCLSNQSVRWPLESAIDFFLDHPCSGSGWSRVHYLDMADTGAACPAHLTLHTSPIRGCGQTNPLQFSCDSIVFPLQKLRYTEVCGRILAYQKGAPEAFENYAVRNLTLESAYVDGVSITHGPSGNRQHIWTFAAARYEIDHSYNPAYACPCSNNQQDWAYQLPPFVGDSYFCDTGNRGPGYDKNLFYVSNPLWDGEGCGIYSSCCQFNSPPWFWTRLPHATSDDIELRLCLSLSHADEDVIISTIELYVR